MITVKIPKELHDKLEKYKREYGLPKWFIIVYGLREALAFLEMVEKECEKRGWNKREVLREFYDRCKQEYLGESV